MKKGPIIGIILAFLAASAVTLVLYVFSVRNSIVRQENAIIAAHEDLQNVHASVYNTIKSQGLSVEKYGSMVIQAIETAIGGRYGEGGVKSAMVWIKEQNPTIDPRIFEKLQVAIEAGYTRFESAQRTKIDRIRVFDNSIEVFPQNVVASIFGFPKKVTDDIRKTVTSAETKETMRTKEMKVIEPFSK